jgi:hypothetical protein
VLVKICSFAKYAAVLCMSSCNCQIHFKLLKHRFC